MYEIFYCKRQELRRLQKFGSHAFVRRQKDTRQRKFDSQVLSGITAGQCRENTYRVLLDDKSIITKLRHVGTVECIGPDKSSTTASGATEFDISD